MYSKEIVNACIMKVSVGTTGHCGGDSGHGARTKIRLENIASCDFRINRMEDEFGQEEIEIILGGDSEIDCFIEALEFILMILKPKIEKVD